MNLCGTCKKEKPDEEFNKDSRRKSGLNSSCKICCRERGKRWKEKHREVYLEKSREYARREYDKDPDKFLNRHREWIKNNPEINQKSNKKSCKKGYEKFKEKRLEYGRLYRKVYGEEKKLMDKAWRLRNPEKVKENAKRAASVQRKKVPFKVKARLLVNYACEIGVLVRPSNCSKCQIECKPEGHHPDYSKPLEVVWLCKQCHTLEHKA